MYSYTVQAAQGVGTRGSLYSPDLPRIIQAPENTGLKHSEGREREIQDRAQSQMECFPFGFI